MVAAAKYFLFLIGPVAVIAASPDRARLTQSVSATTASSPTEPDDTFNFGSTILSADPTIGNNYGPKDWDKVHCNNVDTCPGYPTKWNLLNPFIPFNSTSNLCIDCSKGAVDGACATNNQSPVALNQDVTATNLCFDRHRMNYNPGNARFGKVDFHLRPNVLRAYQPDSSVWPNIDYSWGFPYPWLLRFTDVTVPSQHTLNGKRYGAEIILSHTYSVNFTDTLIGNVAILVDIGTEDDFYPFFELYLRGWEGKSAKIAAHCSKKRNLRGLDVSASDYTEWPAEPEVDDESDPAAQQHRLLGTGTQVLNMTYYQGPYDPYTFYKDTDTEYYFRYYGSVIEPPCLDYVHWRVLRLPVKIALSQYKRLNALFANRLSPSTCQYESAGRVRGGTIKRDVHRSLQTVTSNHKLVYCECINWNSEKAADVAYCNQSMTDRGVFPYGGSGA